jgi:hypothetical protein
MKIHFLIIFLTLITSCGGRVDPAYYVEVKWKNESSKDFNAQLYGRGLVIWSKDVAQKNNVVIIDKYGEDEEFPLYGSGDSLVLKFSDNKKLVYKPKNYYKDFKDERSPFNQNIYGLQNTKNNYTYQYTFDEKDYLMAK